MTGVTDVQSFAGYYSVSRLLAGKLAQHGNAAIDSVIDGDEGLGHVQDALEFSASILVNVVFTGLRTVTRPGL